MSNGDRPMTSSGLPPGPSGPPSPLPRLPDRTANYAREFLSALFMSLRTAQIHNPSNQAYQSALTRLHQSAEALFAASGGFEVRIVDDSFFINGARLTFDPGSNTPMRTLRNLLQAQGLGGFTIETAPTLQGLLELTSLVAGRNAGALEGQEDELRKLNIGVLGIQRIVEGPTAKVDRAAIGVHTYAKLILALRDRIQQLRPHETPESVEGLTGEIRAVRVVQDLVELVSDRLDILLRLAANTHGAAVEELHGANTCVLSVALGHSLGFHRRDLSDLGVTSLFHHLGPYVVAADPRQNDLFLAAALSRTLAETGVGRSLFTRSMILAEQQTSTGTGPRRAHPFSRVLRVAAAYSRLVLGYGVPNGVTRSSIEAITTLSQDPTGWFDPALIDLLVNLLRAFPPGAPIVLESGHYGVVTSALNWRWDRPVVQVDSQPPTSLDLMTQAEGRFVNQIVGTQQYLGTQPPAGMTTPPPPGSVALTPGRQPIGPSTGPRTGSLTVPSSAINPAASPVSSAPSFAASISASLSTSMTAAPSPSPSGPIREASASVRPVRDVGPPRPSPAGGTAASRAISEAGHARGAPRPPYPAASAVAPRAEVDVSSRPLTPLHSAPPSGTAVPPRLDEPAPIEPSSGGDAESGPASRFRQPRPDRLLGSLLAAKYRILEKIGEGGMGTVFLANQEPIDRQVAVKVLHHSLTNDDVAVQRFKREARVISKMKHPNTVTVYDFGQTDEDELYLVMEFLEGQTVAQLLRVEGPLPGFRAARIIRQACGSLSEAHEFGIIHRDLKPDNLFLTRYGDQKDFVKVLDFGLVKLGDNDTVHRLTQQGKVYGTPRYMAPEQAEGKPIDHRSDIYTLGVVLYEMLTGRPLFTAETMVALLVKHIQTPPPPMAAVRPDLNIDPRLESIAMWALAKKASDRPQTVRELARELERWEQEAQSGLAAPSFTEAPPSSLEPSPSRAAKAPPETPSDDFGRSLDALLDDYLEELGPVRAPDEDL